MSKIEEKFIKKTNDWYKYVAKDHHKDRDCHWYISHEEKFSYGDPCNEDYWMARHYGYVVDEQEFIGKTRDEVMQQVIDFINQKINI